MKDSPATAAAIKPIATVIATRLPVTLFTFLVAAIMAVMKRLKKPTAVMPLFSPSMSIRLRRTATPAKAPTAKDIDKIVVAILGASLPAKRLIKSITPITPVKAVRAVIPFWISLTSILARRATTPVRIRRDADIARSDVPNLLEFFPARRVAKERSEITPTNAVRPRVPTAISSGSIILRSLTTPIIR